MGLSKYAPRKAASLEREVRAMELRKHGYTFLAIGKALVDEHYPNGISRQAATKLVERSFKKLNADSKAEASSLRVLELARLDAMRIGLYDKATSGDTGAVLAMLKISERTAKLTGIDQPLQVETKSVVAQSLTDEQLQKMAALFSGN